MRNFREGMDGKSYYYGLLLRTCYNFSRKVLFACNIFRHSRFNARPQK